MSRSRITPNIGKTTQGLATFAIGQARAATNTGFPTWYDPSNGERTELTSGPVDVPEFARQDLSEQFGETTGGEGGTTGDLCSIGLQSAILQSLEAAYRARNVSFVRSLAHAAARWQGHGATDGIVQRAMVSYLQFVDAKAKLGGG